MRGRPALAPGGDRIRGDCPGGAATGCVELFVIAGLAGRDDGQPPGVQQTLELAVAGQVVGGVDRRVVLAEEFGALTFG